MVHRLDVLIPSCSEVHRRTLLSLDRQTMPAADFGVLIGDDGTDPAATARLAELVAHRTNLRRVEISSAPDAALDALLSASDGVYVALLPRGRQVRPGALEQLCDCADAAAADVCAGLTGTVGVRPAVGAAPGRIHRRSTLDRTRLMSDLAGAAATPDPLPAPNAALLDTVVCFLDGDPAPAGPPADPQDPHFRARATAVTWSATGLAVTTRIRTPEGSGPPTAVTASVFSAELGVAWPIPDVTTTRDGADLTVELLVDPDDLAGPGALTDGTWWPSLHVSDAEHDETLLIRAPARLAAGAGYRSRPVVSFASGDRLGVDVGGLSHQVVDRLPPGRAQVVEDARGSLLTCRLPNVFVPAGTVHHGQLRLGGLPFAARLEGTDGGGTVLTAWVSGLRGSYRLRTRFTAARFAETGSRLVIDEVGQMTVRRIAPKKPVASKSAPASRPQRLLRKARSTLRPKR